MGAAARTRRSRWAGAAIVPLESPSMRVRALIVVLVALNLGVAAWWLTRPSPAPRPLPASDKGGVALVLLPAQAATTSPATASGNGDVGPQAAGPAPATCLSVGPFPDRGAAEDLVHAFAGHRAIDAHQVFRFGPPIESRRGGR